MKARSKNCFSTRPYKCRMGCTRGFGSVSAREYHHRSFHAKIRYPCPWILCTKKFTSVYQRKKHVAKGHRSFTDLVNKNKEGEYFRVIKFDS